MTRPEPGVTETIRDGIRRILAPNPGPMTHWGTNTWLLGEKNVAVIDPGPSSEAHLAAILSATMGQTISHILVTHAHADHSPGAVALSKKTGAPVHGFGPPDQGRSDIMNRLARETNIAGGEGLDAGFAPDKSLSDGDLIHSSEWTLKALHMPGHFAGHLCFQYEKTCFSGDHVMEWATTLISPPDGDMGQFMGSTRRMRDLDLHVCFPGHGKDIAAPAERLSELLTHREAREASILAALDPTGSTIEDITKRVYANIPNQMHAAASRNVLAHLVDLWERNRVKADPVLSVAARFRAI